MEDDFVIRNIGGRWVVEAVSERGAAFAGSDPRFTDGRALLRDSEVLRLHEELKRNLLFAGLPDGLPQPGGGLLMRLLLLLLLLLLPVLLFGVLS